MPMNWNRYKGGNGWRVDVETGLILAAQKAQPEANLVSNDMGGAFCYRTKGDPTSMRQLWLDLEPLIREGCERFNLQPNFVLACIGIEANRLKGDRGRFDPRSVREEPGYRSDTKTPNKVSPGYMQTLLSTADDMNRRYGLFPEPDGALDREDLFVPRYSIMLGCAYMRHQMDRLEPDEAGFDPEDPILNVVAAYNAGSVRKTTSNPWHLITYSDTRIDRFIAWNNDSIEVLADEHI